MSRHTLGCMDPGFAVNVSRLERTMCKERDTVDTVHVKLRCRWCWTSRTRKKLIYVFVCLGYLTFENHKVHISIDYVHNLWMIWN